MSQNTRPARSVTQGDHSKARPGRRSFVRDVRGVVAVEFAILAIPFFVLLFVLLETALIFAGEVVIERGVETVGRKVRTGELDRSDMTKERFNQLICDEVSLMIDCTKLKIDLARYETYADIKVMPPIKNGAYDYSGLGYNRGGAQQIMALRVFYEWPVYVDVLRKVMADDNGNFLMVGMAAFKTEAY